MKFAMISNQGRRISPREAPRGALMVDGAGYLWRVESGIHITGCGDSEARLITEVAGGSEWGLIRSDEHQQELPDHVKLCGNPEPGIVVCGLDAGGQPLEWAETNRPDYWNNTWAWFTIGSEDPVQTGSVRFPVRAWQAG